MKNNPIMKNPALWQKMAEDTDSRPSPPQNVRIKEYKAEVKEPKPYDQGQGNKPSLEGYITVGLGILVLMVLIYIIGDKYTTYLSKNK